MLQLVIEYVPQIFMQSFELYVCQVECDVDAFGLFKRY